MKTQVGFPVKVCVCVCVSMHVCMGVERGKPGRRCEIRMAQLHPELRILKCMGGRRQEQDQSILIVGRSVLYAYESASVL